MRVREEPLVTEIEHVVPQLMPPPAIKPVLGLVPVLVTVKVWLSLLKFAVTEVSELTLNVQVGEVPEHAPPQPTKVEPVLLVAVRVTEDPLVTGTEHVVPQLIPPPEIVPEPDPDLETETMGYMTCTDTVSHQFAPDDGQPSEEAAVNLPGPWKVILPQIFIVSFVVRVM
jgi:hypothetical protein